MDKMMKECMKPHALLHTLTGIGLGFIVLALVPGISANALMIGVAAVVVAVLGELFGGNPAKK